MSKDAPVKGRQASLWLPTAGIALATPILAWFAIGDLSFRPGDPLLSYAAGPYHVGPESGYVIGLPAAVVAAVSTGFLVLRTRQGVADRRAWAIAAVLAGIGVIGAYGWRLYTAGIVGGNIGAGFVLLFVLPSIAALLVLAVKLAGGGGRWSVRRTRLLTLAAVLVPRRCSPRCTCWLGTTPLPVSSPHANMPMSKSARPDRPCTRSWAAKTCVIRVSRRPHLDCSATSTSKRTRVYSACTSSASATACSSARTSSSPAANQGTDHPPVAGSRIMIRRTHPQPIAVPSSTPPALGCGSRTSTAHRLLGSAPPAA